MATNTPRDPKEEQAAREIFERYADRLMALARRHMSSRLASRVDPEDVVQSVFRTFFDRAKRGQFTTETPDDLGRLLTRITVNKTLRQVALHRAGRRSMDREVGQADETTERMGELSDREPTPEETVAFVDHLEHFLNRLGSRERRIVELLMQGHTQVEVAEKLGLCERSVRRLQERIRDLAEEEY